MRFALLSLALLACSPLTLLATVPEADAWAFVPADFGGWEGPPPGNWIVSYEFPQVLRVRGTSTELSSLNVTSDNSQFTPLVSAISQDGVGKYRDIKVRFQGGCSVPIVGWVNVTIQDADQAFPADPHCGD